MRLRIDNLKELIKYTPDCLPSGCRQCKLYLKHSINNSKCLYVLFWSILPHFNGEKILISPEDYLDAVIQMECSHPSTIFYTCSGVDCTDCEYDKFMKNWGLVTVALVLFGGWQKTWRIGMSTIDNCIISLLKCNVDCSDIGCSECVLLMDKEICGHRCVENALRALYKHTSLRRTTISPIEFLLQFELIIDTNTQIFMGEHACNGKQSDCNKCIFSGIIKSGGCVGVLESFMELNLGGWRRYEC